MLLALLDEQAGAAYAVLHEAGMNRQQVRSSHPHRTWQGCLSSDKSHARHTSFVREKIRSDLRAGRRQLATRVAGVDDLAGFEQKN